MDLGKVTKIIEVPEPKPIARPVPDEEAPIEAPNWPIRMPIKAPVPAEAD